MLWVENFIDKENFFFGFHFILEFFKWKEKKKKKQHNIIGQGKTVNNINEELYH